MLENYFINYQRDEFGTGRYFYYLYPASEKNKFVPYLHCITRFANEDDAHEYVDKLNNLLEIRDDKLVLLKQELTVEDIAIVNNVTQYILRAK